MMSDFHLYRSRILTACDSFRLLSFPLSRWKRLCGWTGVSAVSVVVNGKLSRAHLMRFIFFSWAIVHRTVQRRRFAASNILVWAPTQAHRGRLENLRVWGERENVSSLEKSIEAFSIIFTVDSIGSRRWASKSLAKDFTVAEKRHFFWKVFLVFLSILLSEILK